jgi:uncharacterized protein (DUF924 family)
MTDDIVTFWFEAAGPDRWFAADPAFDAAVRARFAEATSNAARTALPANADARAHLARVLLLDQIPRNAWRGTPRAFAYDRLARAATAAALQHGLDRTLGKDERLFLYLPLEHSEGIADQERSVALFAALGDPELLGYAVRHRDVIARFGRFPHRNATLGRPSTADELAFLATPGSSF